MSCALTKGNAVFLDHLRWLAALAVVIQHARSLVMVDYEYASGPVAKLVYFLTGFSHQAVIIFFVLSGFLVGGKALHFILDGSTPTERQRFAIDRFARISIVLLPAVALTALVAAVLPAVPVIASDHWGVDVPNAVADATLASWLGTTLLLNEIVTTTTPYNGALWSLAYEWTYYVIAIAAIFLAARDKRARALSIYAYAGILALLCIVSAPLLLAMMLFWLAGALASRCSLRVPFLTLPLFLVAIVTTRFDLLPPFMEDAIVAVATAALIADRAFQQGAFLPRTGVRLASFSYSLYAIHWPIMLGVVGIFQLRGQLMNRLPAGLESYALLGLLTVGSYGAAYLFAYLTELRTADYRKMLMGSRHPPHIPQSTD